jgi:hypothetical protein
MLVLFMVLFISLPQINTHAVIVKKIGNQPPQINASPFPGSDWLALEELGMQWEMREKTLTFLSDFCMNF